MYYYIRYDELLYFKDGWLKLSVKNKKKHSNNNYKLTILNNNKTNR